MRFAEFVQDDEMVQRRNYQLRRALAFPERREALGPCWRATVDALEQRSDPSDKVVIFGVPGMSDAHVIVVDRAGRIVQDTQQVSARQWEVGEEAEIKPGMAAKITAVIPAQNLY